MLPGVLGRRKSRTSKKAWRRYFEARIIVISDWYGVSREEVMDLVAEKMQLGYVGDRVFEAVKADLEARPTRIVDRS